MKNLQLKILGRTRKILSQLKQRKILNYFLFVQRLRDFYEFKIYITKNFKSYFHDFNLKDNYRNKEGYTIVS